MSDRNDFQEDVKTVLRNDRETTAALVRRLKTMSPSDFARLPRGVLERLTYAQYREVAEAIFPSSPVPAVEVPEEPSEERRSVSEIWASLPVWRRSLVMMALATVCSFTAVLGGPIVRDMVDPPEIITRTHRAYEWDRCARLTPQTDGCRYVPERNLRWDTVAALLGMKATTLRELNPHLPRHYAPAGQPIAIWRSLGKLEN